MTQEHVSRTDCEYVRARVADFLAETLDDESHKQVRTHILNCSACARVLAHATEESMTPELTARFSRPMPRPPEAILAALGVRQTGTGTLWANLQKLAAGRADWARVEWEELRDSLQQWLHALTAAPSAVTSRGDEWPEHLDVPVVDTAGHPLGYTLRCEVGQAPVVAKLRDVTQPGKLYCHLRTRAPHFRGGALRCTVTLADAIKVTFTGTWTQVSSQDWIATIDESGLPVVGEPVELPVRSVSFAVVTDG